LNVPKGRLVAVDVAVVLLLTSLESPIVTSALVALIDISSMASWVPVTEIFGTTALDTWLVPSTTVDRPVSL
jgi:hypothetical protein